MQGEEGVCVCVCVYPCARCVPWWWNRELRSLPGQLVEEGFQRAIDLSVVPGSGPCCVEWATVCKKTDSAKAGGARGFKRKYVAGAFQQLCIAIAPRGGWPWHLVFSCFLFGVQRLVLRFCLFLVRAYGSTFCLFFPKRKHKHKQYLDLRGMRCERHI